MSLWGDERAAAIQVGAAILLGFVVLAISMYQVQVVPSQNAEVEFDHNQQLQEQFQEVRADAIGVTDGTRGGSHTMTLGTTYPARTIFVNPGPPSGTLTTTDVETVQLENARAIDGDGSEAYWDGNREWQANSSALVYRPGYRAYNAAPVTVYEHTMLYNRHPNDRDLTVADQLLIDDDELTLITVRGDLQESRSGAVAVRTRALSPTTSTVSVEPDGGSITVTIPTDRPEHWNDALVDEPRVDSVTVEPDAVTVELVDGTYDLRMAEVGVGDASRGAPDDRAAYVVEVDDREPVAVAEVRDQFNNPVRNAAVRYSVEDGTPQSATTNSDGQLRVDDVAEGDRVQVWLHDGPFGVGQDHEEVEIHVVAGGGGGSSAYGTSWDRDAIDDQNEHVTCATRCTITEDEDTTLWMATNPRADGGTVHFSVSDGGIGAVSPSTTTTGSDGTASTTFELTDARNGDEVTVFTSSGGDGDRLRVVYNESVVVPPSFDEVEIRDHSSPNPAPWNGDVEYQVEYTVSDPDDRFDRVEVEFDNRDSPAANRTLESSALADTITHDPPHGAADFGDEYELTIRLYDRDGEVEEERITVEDLANGQDPSAE